MKMFNDLGITSRRLGTSYAQISFLGCPVSNILMVCLQVVMKDVETSVLLTSCLRVLVSVSGFGGDITVLDNLEPPHYQR